MRGLTPYSLKGYPLIVDVSYAGMKQPHSGDWAAWMGGALGEVAYLQQEVNINPTAPYLTFWEWIESGESVCGDDTLEILINTNVVLNTHLCISQNTGGWIQRSVNLQPYSNGDSSLVIRVVTDNAQNSNYYIDDLSFTTSPVITLSPNWSSNESTFLAKEKPVSFGRFSTEK